MSKRKIVIITILLIIAAVSVYGAIKPLPEGISAEGEFRPTDIQFLYDLTYTREGQIVHEQVIFDKIYELIDEAEQFIMIDMFLFNDDYDHSQYEFPDFAENLTNALIAKKQMNPEVQITFITDEVNTFYGVYSSGYLQRLKENNINVVMTDLNKLRDSNPFYSGFWRTALQWFGTSGQGWLPNPFSPDSPEVTVRGYMKLLNFKANHRKVLITDKQGLVTSGNPHDASGFHSNIAFLVRGDILKDLLASEQSVVRFSTGQEVTLPSFSTENNSNADTQVRLVTEGKIRKNLTDVISQTKGGDEIHIGMFYLSDRQIIRELIDASQRGVNIRLILDPNKDAFGRQKNGIPNRSVAYELSQKSGGKIKIKWYDTHGEQFHTKLIMIKQADMTTIFGGSANLTKRNIADYNLETDLQIVAPNDSPIVHEMSSYFTRIWENEDAHYTLEIEEYLDKSLLKKIIYRFQEWSGISTF